MGKYLIYGANGGIGSAIARRLASAGAALHLTGRNGDALDILASELGATYSIGNVLNADDISRIADEAGADLAGLVYAPGTINLKPLKRLSDDDFLNDFRINALGAVNAIQASLDALKAGEGGSVLLFSTIAVSQGFAAHASVSMAKGAVEGLVRALGTELAPHVRVNAIAPSLVDTGLSKAVTSSEQMAKAIAGMHAIPRVGRPEDLAALAEVLLTPAGGWITGQVIGVDGGRSTLRPKG
ncbi:SDR family NAD(P)-dependent oxidoreductase [Oricola cellulosilytica]|uniref:SDR family oxidoreductase n=1 Tax=Oricola cellulosilytica TaxID=1429082 RepID=A0A4R0P6B4_9HYPH|nr:SDR family oxidoreductase [Oricola cellulosilytica]TCD12445.1 SDR family oxidoreductase [Oricola cellulosilytica]